MTDRTDIYRNMDPSTGEAFPGLIPEPEDPKFQLREVGTNSEIYGLPKSIVSVRMDSYDREDAYDLARANMSDADLAAKRDEAAGYISDWVVDMRKRDAGREAVLSLAIDLSDYVCRLDTARRSSLVELPGGLDEILPRARVLDRAVNNFRDPTSELGSFVMEPQSAG